MEAAEWDADAVLTDTQHWLERAVIGLNLCPFAKAVHVRGQIHYAVSPACQQQALACDLVAELRDLSRMSPEERDTTLLMAPACLHDFLDFNDFLDIADQMLAQEGLDGVIQIASFHPRYQFAGAAPEDITNFSNRAPYPTLHLLREASVERAVDAFPDAEQIYGRNIATLEALGHAGWRALGVDASNPGGEPAHCPASRSL